VEAFHQAVGLGVVGGGLGVLDVEEAAQGGPQGRGELGAAVRCDDRWDAESAHPTLKQSRGAVVCCNSFNRYSFLPARFPVNYGR